MFGRKDKLAAGALLPSTLRDLIKAQMNETETDELRAALASVETDTEGAQRLWVQAVCDRAGVPHGNSVQAIKAVRDAYPPLSLTDAVALVKSAFAG